MNTKEGLGSGHTSSAFWNDFGIEIFTGGCA